MEYIVPPSFLFDFRLSIPQCAAPATRKKGRLLKLPPEAELFSPSGMNGGPQFASLRAAWSDTGLAFSVEVRGKSKPVDGTSRQVRSSDCVLLWIDTRPAGNVHRATEYCHHFACLPADDHQDGQPSIVLQPIAQQRATRIESDPKKMLCRSHKVKDGYDLEVWFPGTQLCGFREVAELGRIGFYCVVQDMELGDQPLSVDSEFPTNYDPSTWVQLELKS